MEIPLNSLTITPSMRMKQRQFGKKQQFGASVVQVLLGLVISAFVLLVSYQIYSDSQGKTRVEKATNEIITLISEAQKVYGGNDLYGSVTTAVAVKGGVVPPRMRIAGTDTAQNGYNGAITYTPTTVTTANDALTLSYAAVRPEDCQKIMTTIDSLTIGMAVGATDVKANGGALNVATLATECDAAAPVTLNLRFGRQQ